MNGFVKKKQNKTIKPYLLFDDQLITVCIAEGDSNSMIPPGQEKASGHKHRPAPYADQTAARNATNINYDGGLSPGPGAPKQILSGPDNDSAPNPAGGNF